MARDIHDIYDIIMKIIAEAYGTTFLEYIGIDKKIKKRQNIEITTLSGKKLYLDFLCEATDDSLCHVEFQYPKANENDLDRFFDYNISSQVHHQKLTETCVINFAEYDAEIKQIGDTKCFNPYIFNLTEIDFDEYIKKIKIKVKSNTQFNKLRRNYINAAVSTAKLQK